MGPCMNNIRSRADAFCARYGLRFPILMAPMAGACPASLAAAVAKAGGMGGMGALLNDPAGIAAWVAKFRSAGAGSLQFNVWIPDPPPARDAEREGRVREFLKQWGPEPPRSNYFSLRPFFSFGFARGRCLYL